MTPKQEPVQVAVSPEAVNQVVDSIPALSTLLWLEGQSAADPTSAGQPENDTTTSKGGSSLSRLHLSLRSTLIPDSPSTIPTGEYKGQPYYDKPAWVSWAAFVDAGGEAEPYMKNFG